MQIREFKFNGLMIAFVLNGILLLNGCKAAYTYELYKYSATKENLIATFPGESEFQAEHNCKIFSEMHYKEYGTRLMCLKGGSSADGTPGGGNTGMLIFILIGMAVGMLLVKFYKRMTVNIAACIKCHNPLAEIDLRCSKCDEPVISQHSSNSPTTSERWHKIYLTLLGLSCVIATFGTFLAFRSFYEFARDRSVLEAELRIQKEKVSEFEKKSRAVDLIEKQIPIQEQPQKPKFDPTKPYEVVDENSGRSYPPEIFEAMQKALCISALLDEDGVKNHEFCDYRYKEQLDKKVRGGLYSAGRFEYHQMIVPALLFMPLIFLVLGRIWFLWVFVQTNKSS